MREYSDKTKSEFLNIIRNYYDAKAGVHEVSDMAEMMDFAIMHQLQSLYANMLLDKATTVDINRAELMTVYLKNIQVNHAMAKASNDFAKYLREKGAKFSFIKGQYIKDYYKPFEVRSMGDIDVYIPSEYESIQREYFDANGFEISEYYAHVTTYKKGFVEFEVHSAIEWFGEDWSDTGELTQDGFSLSTETALTIVHAMKHIAVYGCGMRQVLDIALLLREDSEIITNSDFKSRLERLHILKCYYTLIALINRWFGTNYETEEDSEAVDILAESVLVGGVFGKNLNDYSTVNTVKNKSKFGMYWHMLFPSYERMILSYPKLNGKRYLLPYYHMKRLWERGVREKRYKIISTTNEGDASLEIRRKYMEKLALNEQFYNKF